MESSKKASDLFDLEGIQRRLEQNAREQGFPSSDELLRDEESKRVARAEAEWLARLPARREAIVSKLDGRAPPEVLDELRSGAPPAVHTKGRQAVQAWLASSKPALVIYGGAGGGKSIGAIRAMIEHRGTWQYIRATEVGKHYERWQSEREDHIEPLRVGCSFMVVDDLGQEPLEDRRVVSALNEITDGRQSMSRRTVYTSNLELEAIRERYSEPVRSRWAQCATFIRIADVDHRRARRAGA
jgi:hypothetical protein